MPTSPISGAGAAPLSEWEDGIGMIVNPFSATTTTRAAAGGRFVSFAYAELDTQASLSTEHIFSKNHDHILTQSPEDIAMEIQDRENIY